jgi:transposase
MPKLLTIQLTTEQRQELEQLRDTHELAYLRERAAAILKIADGLSGRQVAQRGLLRPRYRGTVYDWFHRYEAKGVEGLKIKAGRGRKPAFSPSVPGQRQCS